MVNNNNNKRKKTNKKNLKDVLEVDKNKKEKTTYCELETGGTFGGFSVLLGIIIMPFFEFSLLCYFLYAFLFLCKHAH